MEIDLILLPKAQHEETLHLGIKKQIHRIFESIYNDVTDSSFSLELNGIEEIVSYRISAKTENTLFVKFICDNTPAKSAKILDEVVNKLIRGEHRKKWNIVISYDEVSQLYCCKLMPLFGKFERKTRELVYITIIKIFGVDWYEKSFEKSLQDDLKSRGKNTTQLIEGALNELTYEQLKQYLFTPFSTNDVIDLIDNQLAAEQISDLSREEIILLIDKCRKISLWDRFFSEFKQFKDFNDRINKLQPIRNTVMHHKRLTQAEYEKTRRELTVINRKLSEAIILLEEEMYTETTLKDVVSALGKMLENVLGSSVVKWMDKMKPSLASFGKLAIEAAMPRINIPDILPQINLGVEMAQKFNNVYQVPNIAAQLSANMAQYANLQNSIRNLLPDMSYINQVNSILNTPGMKMAQLVAEQTKSILDAPGMKMAQLVAEQANSMQQMVTPYSNINLQNNLNQIIDENDEDDLLEDIDNENEEE